LWQTATKRRNAYEHQSKRRGTPHRQERKSSTRRERREINARYARFWRASQNKVSKQKFSKRGGAFAAFFI